MINEHATTWLGHPVKLFDAAAAKKGITDYKNTIYRLATDWDNEIPILELFARFIDNPKSVDTPAIIIGAFAGDDTDATSASIIDRLVSARAKLPNLKGIFVGDILSEENEISWIKQSDVSGLFSAYPRLEHFRVRGADGLAFDPIQHAALKSLVVESGGMAKDLVEEISLCGFPNLEHLELWLGTDNYGWNGSLDDILPFLDRSRYPKLTYLGLKNSDIENEIAEAVVRSNILSGLKVLDLSMGVMTDEGARALLACDELKYLEKLDLHHHYISPEMQNQLRDKFPTADLSDMQEPDEYKGEIYRSVAVGE